MYDFKESLCAVAACRQAYVDAPKTTLMYNLYLRGECHMGTARALIYNNAILDVLHIASRGTLGNVADWLHDLDAEMTLWEPQPGYGQVEVHDGFLNDMMLIKELLDNVVLPHVQAGGKVAVEGHSKGASECILYGLTLPKDCIVSAYTYGQPMIGGKDFATVAERHYGDKYHRVVNDTDIVTHVPGGDKYCHFGANVLEYDQGGTPRLRFQQDPLSINLVRDVKDHSIDLYYQRTLDAVS